MNEPISKVSEAGPGEPVIPLPEGDIPWAQNFRGTWVVSSLEGLRTQGYFDAYQAHLGEHRDEILSCLAGTWLPISAALEHYQACDRLNLSDAEYAQLAKAGAQVRTQWNARVIAELKSDGATPWTAMKQLAKTWKRSADGGAFGAFKLDETSARATYVNCELFDVAYFRRAVRMMVFFMCRYKGNDVKVIEVPGQPRGAVMYAVDWK